MKLRSLLPFALALAVTGCAEVAEQLHQMAVLSKCQFRLASVQDVSLAEVPLRSAELSDIRPMDLLRMRGAFTQGGLPLRFTLNVEAKNPNPSAAGMNRMEWVLFVDGNRFTQGVLESQVILPPGGGVGTFPLAVALDLREALSGKTLGSMIHLALHIAGEGTQPTRVTLQVKPSILVGGRTIDYPGYVTVTHEFGKDLSD